MEPKSVKNDKSAGDTQQRRRRANFFGPRIAQLREAAGLSHADMLARLHQMGWQVERTVWVKLEMGLRLIVDWELCLIARALNVSLDQLRPQEELKIQQFVHDRPRLDIMRKGAKRVGEPGTRRRARRRKPERPESR